ncbi:MAG: PA14 domain-containing protein [Anaerolineales bacterium]
MEGPPALQRQDAEIDMNWLTAAPVANLPADGFSVRWERRLQLTPGIYRFQLGADDGARLFVNNDLLLETMTDGDFEMVSHDIELLTTEADIRLEYFDQSGLAGIRLTWERLPDSASTTEPTTTLPVAGRVTTQSSYVYAQPIPTSPIERLNLYQEIAVAGHTSDGQWYQVVLPDEQEGWVAARSIRVNLNNEQYSLGADRVHPLATLAQPGRIMAPTRLHPLPELSPTIETLPSDTEVFIASYDPTGKWLRVQLTADTLSGWVYAPLVQRIPQLSADTPSIETNSSE